MSTERAHSAAVDDVREHVGAFTYDGSPDAPALVRARHRDARGRTVRAATTLGACWGFAVIAVFLPVLHFVLVPALLVLGPALAWQRLHEADTLVLAAGHCPACGASQSYAIGQPWRQRTRLRCEGCGRALELRLPAAPAGD